jgi:hypothetical protein
MDDFRRLSLEQQDRSVHRLCEGASEDQLSACVRFPSKGEVRGPKLAPALQVVGSDIVE